MVHGGANDGDTCVTWFASLKTGFIGLQMLFELNDQYSPHGTSLVEINHLRAGTLQNALMLAIDSGNIKSAYLLIGRGINLTARDSEGRTALAYTRNRAKYWRLASRIRSECKKYNLVCM